MRVYFVLGLRPERWAWGIASSARSMHEGSTWSRYGKRTHMFFNIPS